MATIRIELKANKRGKGPGRQKYQESTKEQMEERNHHILNKLKTLTTEGQEDSQTKTAQLNKILEEGTKKLPTIPKTEKEEAFSEHTRQLLQQRKTR